MPAIAAERQTAPTFPADSEVARARSCPGDLDDLRPNPRTIVMFDVGAPVTTVASTAGCALVQGTVTEETQAGGPNHPVGP